MFAAGRLAINYPCVTESEAPPCLDSTAARDNTEFRSKTYKATVVSFMKTEDKYVATLIFENLTDKEIKVGWEEKNPLLLNGPGPYLIDENGAKYFAVGYDSGKIIRSGMVMGSNSELIQLSPRGKLTSHFVFSGNGSGTVFKLIAKEIRWPGGDSVRIDGLRITS